MSEATENFKYHISSDPLEMLTDVIRYTTLNNVTLISQCTVE